MSTNAINYRKYSRPWKNEIKLCRFVWSFADDGGVAGTFVLGQFEKKVLVKSSRTWVETLCTSGGSATLKLGTTSDDDCFMDATSGAVASLTADNINTETAGQNLVVPAADYVNAIIGTADMTAGKVWVLCDVVDL